jgi:hypothetical protein
LVATKTTPTSGVTYETNVSLPCTCFESWTFTAKAIDNCSPPDSNGASLTVVINNGTSCGLGCSITGPVPLAWTSSFEMQSGAATLVLNNSSTHRFQQGQSAAQGKAVANENRIDVVFDRESSAGIWRFQLARSTMWDPAGVRIIEGEALAITQTGIIFRLKGTPGERVSFTFDRP